MTMQALANVARQYFYTQDGELSAPGVAAIGSVLTAIGGGTVFLAEQVWSRCCGSEKPSSVKAKNSSSSKAGRQLKARDVKKNSNSDGCITRLYKSCLGLSFACCSKKPKSKRDESSDDEEVYHTPRGQPPEDEDDKVFEVKEPLAKGPSALELDDQIIFERLNKVSARLDALNTRAKGPSASELDDQIIFERLKKVSAKLDALNTRIGK
jgi:hypothetical protein